MRSVKYTTCSSDDQLHQILALQKANLRHVHSAEVEQDQGFVTVHHAFDVLKAMNEQAQHIIALDEGQVVGYALAMTTDFGHKIPELVAMFDMLNDLVYKGQSLSETNYLVMGQVCVAASHRGQGVFQGMYKHYFNVHLSSFDVIVTEIAERNTRSLRAHEKIGFHTLYTYHEEGSETWVVVAY
jgi:predicted GNAT superfamily acetyltransferase